jgi:hypothetical protein
MADGNGKGSGESYRGSVRGSGNGNGLAGVKAHPAGCGNGFEYYHEEE